MSLIYMHSCMTMLQARSIPFVMTCADDLIKETQWHCDDAILCLQQQILPCISDFDGRTFLQWSTDQGFAISSAWHPLEAAHAAAAEFMWPSIDAILRRA